ncbi:hypothetical protein HDV06_005283 [Boothiomyces sp. JEL0866]|nr:hypothetical protein HDV06_005283 [Boothiomyces sp. JEL0866]
MQHSQKCPNCRSNLGKLIQLPDEFFIELIVKEQDPFTPALVCNSILDSVAIRRLHRDLDERQRQVEQLELELEDARCQIEDYQDSSDTLNEIEMEELQAQIFTLNRKLTNEEQRNATLLASCHKLESTVETLLVEKEKLARENIKCNELLQENAMLKAQLKQSTNSLKLAENKLKAFCGLHSISLDKTDIEYEHLSRKELQELIVYNSQKLQTETREKEMFKEKFLKLKQHSESAKKEFDTKIKDLEKVKENNIPPVNTLTIEKIQNEKTLGNICAPGSKNTKRKFEKFVEKKELKKPVKSVVPTKAWFNR